MELPGLGSSSDCFQAIEYNGLPFVKTVYGTISL